MAHTGLQKKNISLSVYPNTGFDYWGRIEVVDVVKIKVYSSIDSITPNHEIVYLNPLLC